MMRRQRGQSLVEFSLFITFLFILFAGIADLGRFYYQFVAVRDAAQEGASYGAIYPFNVADIQTRVRQTSAAPVDLNDGNATITVAYHDDFSPIGTVCAGDGIRVTVAYPFTIAAPFLGAIVGSQQLPLRATVEDTILRPACP